MALTTYLSRLDRTRVGRSIVRAICAALLLIGIAMAVAANAFYSGAVAATTQSPGAVYDYDDQSTKTRETLTLQYGRQVAFTDIRPRSRASLAAKAGPTIKPGSAGGPTAGKPFSRDVKQEARDRDPTATCVFCGRPGTGTQVDHAIPRSRGGNATIDNAQLACPWCNPSKGARNFPVNPPPGFEGRWPPPWWSPKP